MRYSHYTYTSVLSKGERIGVEVEGRAKQERGGCRKGQGVVSPFVLNGVNLSIFTFLYIL